MKNVIFIYRTAIIMVIIAGILLTLNSYAGTDKDKPDKKTVKIINKTVKKESKKLYKKGFFVEPGALSMEMQMRESMRMELMLDNHGDRMYLMGVGSAISSIQNAARAHAVSDAINNAAVILEGWVFGAIEADYNNKLYSRDEYETLSQMKSGFTKVIMKHLPSGVPVSTLMRDDGTIYEYQIRMAFPMKVVRNSAKETLRDMLGKENEALRKKYEKITGLDKLINPDN